MKKLKKNDYVIVNDSFEIKHLVEVVAILEKTELQKNVYGGIVIKSISDSNLNTLNFTDDDIEMFLDRTLDIDNLERDYPELWI
jgi:hypothetical protein